MQHILITILLAFVSLSTTAQTVDNDNISGCWTGKLKVGFMQLTININLVHNPGQEWKCTLDSPDQSVKDIPATLQHFSADSIAVSIPAIGASYKAHISGENMKGTFTQMGQNFPLDLKHEEVKLNRPQEPKAPLPYPTEEIQFTNEAAGATFSGTLSLPVGFKPEQSETFPVVIMVTGSGQENRDEEIFEHKPFFVIADFLARNGIATLRYDDRAFGKSVGGDLKNATTADFFDDAKAGISYLRKVRNFKTVGILGHSEGGNIAFMAGAEGLVDFVVCLAAVGVRGDEALTAQANDIMKRSGIAQQQTLEEFRAQVKQLHNAWLDHFIDYDPTPFVSATRCPVMAINGKNDCQVLCDLNLIAIEKTLPKNKKNLVKSYDRLNHLFQHSTTGLPTEYRQIEETISPDVLSDIVGWIKSL